jgi:hypothetical protein
VYRIVVDVRLVAGLVSALLVGNTSSQQLTLPRVAAFCLRALNSSRVLNTVEEGTAGMSSSRHRYLSRPS